MKKIFNKTILAVLTAALVFASFPVTSVFAQGENVPANPNPTLEKAWASQLQKYAKLGKMFDDNNARLVKLQARLDQAAAKGKDVTAVQTALNNFKAALETARPIYASMDSIISAHQGFDASGKVTDAAQAKTTLEAMRVKLEEIKSAMNGTGKALRDALKAFRAAHISTD
jgi:hypothetical protein